MVTPLMVTTPCPGILTVIVSPVASRVPLVRVKDATDFLWDVNLEDRDVVEALFAGTASPLAEPGPLSWLERENHEFAAWLARRLAA